ncbi:hypothetical protein BDF14DRAFT_1732503 [Spinellus fusiger]|nr:hypothetical protein BDF14DRAFT_1732503 [Spinellus fusiger]
MKYYACLLLLFLQSVVAQHHHDRVDEPLPSFNVTGTEPLSYSLFPEYKTYFYLHVVFMVLSFWILLPIGIMLGIARSSLHIPTQITCFVTAMLGFFFARIYGHSAPHLYTGNSHHSMGWSIFLLLILQMSVSVMRKIANLVGRMNTSSYESFENMRLVHRYSHSYQEDQYSESSCDNTLHNSGNEEEYAYQKSNENEEDENHEDKIQEIPMIEDQLPSWLQRLETLTNYVPQRIRKTFVVLAHNPLTTTGFRWIHQIVGRVFPVLIFVQTLSGLVVYHGVCRSWEVLGCIAHLIKGGIFFFYGVITFGRYLGAFADRGWAWNRVDNGSSYSFEMIENVLIFTYGITNTWMEHFGQESTWSHKDFEHASLAFMWWWCGLVGILIESCALRRLLNRTEQVFLQEPKHEQTQSYSLNPFPALTVLLTGISMGNHHQDTSYSTQVHYMWGLLLAMSSICRFITYLSLYQSLPTSALPSRPPSEAVSAFLLVAGSILFMASNAGTMTWLRQSEVDSMFLMNVCVALSSITFIYVASLMLIKAWATKRETFKKEKRRI